MGGSRRWIFLGRSKTLVDFCAVFVGGFFCGFFWLAKNVGEFRWWISVVDFFVDFLGLDENVGGFRLWISFVDFFVDFFWRGR